MNIETERLKIFCHQARFDQEGRMLAILNGGGELEVPKRYHHLFQMTLDGASLARMARSWSPSGGHKRFETLARYLGWLNDHGLLVDRRATRLAESLRPDYSWKESIAFERILSFELFSFSDRKTDSLITGAVSLAIAAVSAFLVWTALPYLKSSWTQALEIRNLWPVLLAFLFTFGVGRSVQAILQFLAMAMTAGFGAALRLKADSVSVSLETDELSKARGGFLFVLVGLLTGFGFLSPLWLGAQLPETQPLLPFIAYFTLLLLLAEISPFVKSHHTEWLRALYNFADQRAVARRQVPGALEASMKLVHILSNVLWVCLLALFIAWPTTSFYQHLLSELNFSSRSVQVSGVIFALTQLIILISFLDDMASSISYGAANDSRRIRRIWKRQRPELAVDEAIQKGRVPEREELAKLPLLRQLEPELRDELISKARVVDLSEGQAACRQFDSDRSLFILLSGRMAVAKRVGARRRRVVALLEAGSVFGEAAFFFGKKRTADVVAMEESRLLIIEHDAAMSNLDQKRSEELQLRIWFLQSLLSGSFLRELPSEAFDALVFAGKKKVINAGERIISEGDIAKACYFIVQGQASVLQNTKLINRLKAGDVFGEIALLQPDTLRTATVIADSQMIVVRINGAKLWDLLSSHLPLALEIERLAEQRLMQDRERSHVNEASVAG